LESRKHRDILPRVLQRVLNGRAIFFRGVFADANCHDGAECPAGKAREQEETGGFARTGKKTVAVSLSAYRSPAN